MVYLFVCLFFYWSMFNDREKNSCNSWNFLGRGMMETPSNSRSERKAKKYAGRKAHGISPHGSLAYDLWLVEFPPLEGEGNPVSLLQWMEYGTSDGTPFSRWGYQRLCSCLAYLWGLPCLLVLMATRPHIRICFMERPTWPRTEGDLWSISHKELRPLHEELNPANNHVSDLGVNLSHKTTNPADNLFSALWETWRKRYPAKRYLDSWLTESVRQ